MSKRLPAIPAVPPSAPRELRPFLEAAREVLQVQAGLGRGDSMDRAVTFRDLRDKMPNGNFSALGKVISGLIETGAVEAGGRVDRPHTPTGVKVSAYAGGIYISWDMPRYSGHAFTEIYSHPVAVDSGGEPTQAPNLDLETMLSGTGAGASAGLTMDTGLGYYVWVRHVNFKGQSSGVHDALGTYVFLPHNPSYYLDQLAGQISESELANHLKGRIDLVDGPSSLAGSVAARLSAEASSRIAALAEEKEARDAAIFAEQKARKDADSAMASDITELSATVVSNKSAADAAIAAERQTRTGVTDALASDLSTLSATVAGNKIAADAAVDAERQARADETGALASDIATVQSQANGISSAVQTLSQAVSSIDGEGSAAHKALWSVKAQAGDVTAGIGLIADGQGGSEVAVAANRLVAFDPAKPTTKDNVFVVEGGKLYVNTAFFKDAYIEQLAAQQVTAERVNALDLNAVNITGGQIHIGDNFSVDTTGNMNAKDAVLNNVVLDGNLDANNGRIRGAYLTGVNISAEFISTKGLIDSGKIENLNLHAEANNYYLGSNDINSLMDPNSNYYAGTLDRVFFVNPIPARGIPSGLLNKWSTGGVAALNPNPANRARTLSSSSVYIDLSVNLAPSGNYTQWGMGLEIWVGSERYYRQGYKAAMGNSSGSLGGLNITKTNYGSGPQGATFRWYGYISIGSKLDSPISLSFFQYNSTHSYLGGTLSALR